MLVTVGLFGTYSSIIVAACLLLYMPAVGGTREATAGSEKDAAPGPG